MPFFSLIFGLFSLCLEGQEVSGGYMLKCCEFFCRPWSQHHSSRMGSSRDLEEGGVSASGRGNLRSTALFHDHAGGRLPGGPHPRCREVFLFIRCRPRHRKETSHMPGSEMKPTLESNRPFHSQLEDMDEKAPGWDGRAYTITAADNSTRPSPDQIRTTAFSIGVYIYL